MINGSVYPYRNVGIRIVLYILLGRLINIVCTDSVIDHKLSQFYFQKNEIITIYLLGDFCKNLKLNVSNSNFDFKVGKRELICKQDIFKHFSLKPFGWIG